MLPAPRRLRGSDPHLLDRLVRRPALPRGAL